MTKITPPSEFADDKHRQQAEELLLEHGRFCVAFERVCEAMRHSIILIFLSQGLTHEGLAQVVIGDKGSAELQILLGALFSELRSTYNDSDNRAVQGLLREVMDLTEARNLVIHSAWRFGKNAAFAELYATTIRPRTKQKKGAVPEIHGVSAKYLCELTACANALELKLKKLQNCIMQSNLDIPTALAG
ncbi:hypothetical protein [Duganella sp. BJB475]|uniref:hypothetical protein n=1 Tax=Duganella sp. BJB475 TaxID=2233914 RepID=UPI0011C0E82E|nr:hypothetical protein [Duganella sp. BJB475]